MPIKDLKGTPRDPRKEAQVLAAFLRRHPQMYRIAKNWLRRRGPDDDAADPVVPPQGPKPLPLQGGAEAEI